MNAFKQTKEKACAVEWRNALPANLQQIENRFTTKCAFCKTHFLRVVVFHQADYTLPALAHKPNVLGLPLLLPLFHGRALTGVEQVAFGRGEGERRRKRKEKKCAILSRALFLHL